MTAPDSPRRVGVNLMWLVPGVVGGTEEWTVGLLEAFAARAERHPDLEVTLFANRLLASAHPRLVGSFPTVVAPVTGRSKGLRAAAEATWLLAAMRRRGVELAHHPGGTAPLLGVARCVVSIHDLQPFSIPQNFSRLKRSYLRAMVGPSARRALRVTTLSAWVRDDVVRRLGVPVERTALVPYGVVRSASVSRQERREARDRVGVGDEPFLLYPAIPYVHKNHELLVRVVARLRDSGRRVGLVLTGAPGPCDGHLSTLVSSLGVFDLVRRPGRVPAEVLAALYAEAAALTFPSRYEGFGLPVLEAMSAGCPVLASDVAALPEVVADAGVLLPPDDPEAWSAAVLSVLDDPDHRDRLVAAGRRRSEGFGWDSAAASLEDVYRAALRAAPPGRREVGS